MNICDAATTLPIKNPTATLLWNFLMITVPPTQSSSNTIDDQRLTNASVPPRDDIVYMAMKIWTIDMKRMKYLAMTRKRQLALDGRGTTREQCQPMDCFDASSLTGKVISNIAGNATMILITTQPQRIDGALLQYPNESERIFRRKKNWARTTILRSISDCSRHIARRTGRW